MPRGFEAMVVADSIGRTRHIAVNYNGDIYVKLRSSPEGEPGNVAIRDTNRDGKADIIKRFGIYNLERKLPVIFHVLIVVMIAIVFTKKITE